MLVLLLFSETLQNTTVCRKVHKGQTVARLFRPSNTEPRERNILKAES